MNADRHSSPAARGLAARGLASCGIAIVLLSCKPAPMTNTVIAKATSPDGKSLALLIDRYYQAARVADGFFLMVMPSGQAVDQAISARNIDDRAALVATWANKVQLRWRSNDTLLVTCDSCGLKAIDIVKKLDHVGSVKIVYEGFPEHTAYSRLINPVGAGGQSIPGWR